jgi:uncharacterized iron-regulated membrane protein
MIFAILLLSGLVIWYPRKMSKAMLKGMFFIKTSANWKRINYDSHNVLGFYAVIPLLMICYSALIWSFEDWDAFITKTLNGGAKIEEKVKSKIPLEDQKDQKNVLNIIGNKVDQEISNKKSALISFPRSEEGTYYAEVVYDNRQYRNDQYNFDQYSGRILRNRTYKDADIEYGTALRERNYDLHMGSILGISGRIIYFLAALIAVSLPITGLIIFFNRKKKKKK